MAFFDDLGKKISQVGQAAVQKTKDFTSVAKLNSAISDKEKQLLSIYAELGKLYASVYGENCESQFADLIAKIKAAESEIAELHKQCQDIKGVIRCEKCGSEIANNAAFCNACGARVAVNPASAPKKPLVKCESCGAMVEEGSKFCVSCGSMMQKTEVKEAEKPAEAFCVNCNAPLQSDTVFCTNCGTKRSDI